METVIQHCSLIGLKYRNDLISRIFVLIIIIISEGWRKNKFGP